MSDWVGRSTADAEAGLALRAAGEAELAGDRRAVVDEVDLDRHPRPDPGVPAEQDAGVHRRVRRRPPRAAARRARSARSPRTAIARAACAVRRGCGWRSGDERSGAWQADKEGLQDGRTAPLGESTPRSAQGRPTPAESCTSLGRVERGYRTMARSRAPAGQPGRSLGVPCPRSVPSAPSASTVQRRRPGRVVAPPYDVIGPAEHEPAAGPSRRATSSVSTCAGRRARRRARRSLPPGGADARCVAVRRDPPQGSASVDLRVRAGLPRAGHRACERTQRGFFARLRLEPFGPGSGVLPARADAAGPRRRTATSSSGRPASTRARWSGCTTTRPAPGGRSSTSCRRAPLTRRRR